MTRSGPAGEPVKTGRSTSRFDGCDFDARGTTLSPMQPSDGEEDRADRDLSPS
jgi:hypothetical protein